MTAVEPPALLAALRNLADVATSTAALLEAAIAADDIHGGAPSPPPAAAAPAAAAPSGPLDSDVVHAALVAHGRPCSPGDLVTAVGATTPQSVYWALRRLAKAGRAREVRGQWRPSAVVDLPDGDDSDAPGPPAGGQDVPAPSHPSNGSGPETAPQRPRPVESDGGRSQLPAVESTLLDRWKLLDLVITYGDGPGLTASACVQLLPWGVSSRLESSYDVLQVLQSLERDGHVVTRRGRWTATDAGVAADAEHQGGGDSTPDEVAEEPVSGQA